MTLILLAGHGAGDPGTVSNNTTEHAEVANIVDKIVRNFKVETMEPIPLVKRIALLNKLYDAQDCVVEVHMNSAIFTATGVEVFYEDGLDKDREKAMIMSHVISRKLGLTDRGAKPDTSTKHKHLGIIRDTISRSFLIELGFITNKEDLRVVREKGAEAVLEALREIAEIKPRIPNARVIYEDVVEGDDGWQVIEKMQKKGIATGPKFYPNLPLTRKDAARMFERLGLLDR